MRRLVLAAATAACLSSTAGAATVACDVAVDVADQDPAGLNVRASPGGAIVTAVKARGRWVEVEVTGQDGAWARIKTAKLEADENDNTRDDLLWKGVGWVAFSKLGVEEFDSRARFLATTLDCGTDDGGTSLGELPFSAMLNLPCACRVPDQPRVE